MAHPLERPLDGLLNLPEVRIAGDETCRVHLNFGDEPAARTFVTVGLDLKPGHIS